MAELPPGLRFLKGLVITLMLAMIGGVITITALLVTRLPQPGAATAPVVPQNLALPSGTRAMAVTFGPGWTAVVTTDNTILIFDATTGALRQTVHIAP